MMAVAYLTGITIMLCGVYMGLITCADPKCVLKDMCSCEMSDGSGTVDLTSLGNKDNTPRFKEVKCDGDGWFYSYNPCGGFDDEQYADMALSGLSEAKTQTRPLGKADLVMFKYNIESGNVQAGYHVTGVPTTSSDIELICDKSACEPQFEPFGHVEGTYFLMQIKSICACPGMCTASGPITDCPSGVSLSAGTIILIGFSSCLILYEAIGVSYQKIKHKSSGKYLIPNRTTWISLATYIGNGFNMIMNCVRRRDRERLT